MEFTINHPNGAKDYTFPKSLSEIKLKDRIAFYNKYGNHLDKQLNKIQQMQDGEFKDLELSMWAVENATAHISHYCGIDINVVRQNLPIDIVMNIFNTDMQLMAMESQNIELALKYDLGTGDTWRLTSPVINYGNDMTVDEFCTSKEVVRQLMELGQGFWPALPYLCAIFLRKEGEPFTEELVAENSERMAFMNELPMNIAMAVAFFLSSSISTYKTTSLYSNQAEEAV